MRCLPVEIANRAADVNRDKELRLTPILKNRTQS